MQSSLGYDATYSLEKGNIFFWSDSVYLNHIPYVSSFSYYISFIKNPSNIHL